MTKINKTRKRGTRKKVPGKRHRNLIKEAEAARVRQTLLESETDDEILSSVESNVFESKEREPEGWQALEDELRGIREEEEEEEREEEDDDDMREVSWSPSPEPGLDDAGPQFAIEEQVVAVQPYGKYCIVICRLSSEKKEKKTTILVTDEDRKAAHYERRRQEGRELARRLAANCPAPFEFDEVFATAHKRQATISTNWQSQVEPRSAMEKDISGWFRRPTMRGREVTVLIRTISGITCDVNSFKSFLVMIKRAGVKAQLIFQYNKVYPEIDPHCLRNFKGLGATVDIMAADFLEHLEGTLRIPLVARILEIWAHITTSSGNQQGIQYCNTMLAPDATQPVRAAASGRVGR